MAITYDNKANPGINTLSWSHNNSGSLLVVVCCFYDYADYVNSITYGGVALTQAVEKYTTSWQAIEIWYLVNPPTGTNTVSVSETSSSDSRYYSASFNSAGGVHTTNTNNGSSGAGSVGITPTINNCLLLAGLSHEDDTLPVTNGETEIYAHDNGTSWGTAASYYIQTTAGLQTMDWTGGDDYWVAAAVAFKEVTTSTNANNAKANIRNITLQTDQVSFSFSSGGTPTYVNTIKANIKQTVLNVNSSKASLVLLQTYNNYSLASIVNSAQKINFSKANIWKANNYVTSSKACIYSSGNQVVYIKGNILYVNNEKINTCKANIIRTVVVNVFSNGYRYRRKATIDNTKVAGSSNFTDFTVLFDSTYNGFKSLANGGYIESASGYDIRFESTAGVKLSHEIEYYDASSGRIRAWVKIPTLYGSSDTEYYVYFGKSGLVATEEDPTGTWRSQDVGVWHLKENPGGGAPQLLDSTSNDGDLTTAGSMTSSESVDGKIYKAVKFLGAGDYASHTDDTGDPLKLSGNSTATIRCWLNATSLPTSENIVMSKYTYASNNGWVLEVVSTGQLRTKIGSTSYTTTSNYVSTGNTYMIHAVLTGGTAWRFYVNGQYQEQVTFASKTITASTAPFAMACASDALGVDTYDFHGWEDEARVYTDDVSDDWITTEYNTENDPSTFYSLGSLETMTLSSKANIPGSHNNRAKANIKYTESKVNYARGYIFSTGAQTNVSKANIRVNDNTKVNTVKANIRFTWTKDVYVKASLVSVVSKVNYVKSDIWRPYTNVNSVKGNINVAGTSVVCSKANIKYSYTKVNYAKASLSAPFTDINYIKASIIKVGNTKVNYSKASLYFQQTKLNYVKADIGTKIYTYTAQSSLPTDSADLGTKYTTQNYTDVATLDTTRVSLNTTSAYYVIHQYKDKHSNSVATITASWTGQSDVAASICTIYLQIYNVNSATWETLDSDNSTAANTNINLIGSVTSNMSNYYATGNWVTCRVYQRNI